MAWRGDRSPATVVTAGQVISNTDRCEKTGSPQRDPSTSLREHALLTELRRSANSGYSAPFANAMSAAFSPMAIVVTLVLARMQSGMIEASATLKPSMP